MTPAIRPVTDIPSMFALRLILRRAYVEGRTLPQSDPSVRDTLTKLDELCCDLTNDIEGAWPELPLSKPDVVCVR